MDTKSNTSKPSDPGLALETLTKKKETLSHNLVGKAEKVNQKAGELVVIAKKKRTVKQKLVKKTEKLNQKAGELVVTAKKKEAIDDDLVKTAEKLSLKAENLQKENKFMVGRELKMIEQKKEIAELKKSQ